ncbi:MULTISPECIES: DUF1992 domain-containing protein [unclassified Brachybacterium]|uniref:DnaJ family domain-containing protein n=1 Tax=unclassified Brachybacterium TaxID=2623841 RepID=UPI003612F160
MSETDGPRRPPMAPDVARVESALEQARARGDFDDLPGAGKPLNLPDTHDPDWWIRQRVQDGDIDRDALLPVVMLLRREFERREETLAELPTEEAAREYAEDYTRRVHDDRRANPLQRTIAPEMYPEDAAKRWRELREAAAAARPAPEPTETEEKPRPRRRWWPFGRS